MSISRLIGVALVGLLAQSAVFSAGITIGNSNIVVPSIDSYSFLDTGSSDEHLFASSLAQKCDQKPCVVLLGPSPETEHQSWADIAPIVKIQILDDTVSVDDEHFAAFKQAAKADIDGLRAIVAGEVDETAFEDLAVSSEGELLQFIDSPWQISDDVVEGDSYLAVSGTFESRYQQTDEAMLTYMFRFTSGAVLVRDKVLTIMVLGPGSDAGGQSSVFERIAHELLSANNSPTDKGCD